QMQKVNMNYSGKKVYLPSVFLVDSTFLDIFDFQLVSGSRPTVLQKPNSILLTEESAKKLFGSSDPIGKIVQRYSDDTTNLTVTGILKNVPANSHMQFDGLVSFSTIYRPQMMENWGGNWLVTYLDLAPNANITAMERKFPAYLKQHMTRND